MASVVVLGAGEDPPRGESFVLVSRSGAGETATGPIVANVFGARCIVPLADANRALAEAMRQAEEIADREAIGVIYVQVVDGEWLLPGF